MAAFVVGIGGTTRPGSSTETLLRHALATLEIAGVETECFAGNDLVFPLYTAGDEPADTAFRLVEAVRRADGVVIASPGYHGTISGLVKNALDQLEESGSHGRAIRQGTVRHARVLGLDHGVQQAVGRQGLLVPEIAPVVRRGLALVQLDAGAHLSRVPDAVGEVVVGE